MWISSNSPALSKPWFVLWTPDEAHPPMAETCAAEQRQHDAHVSGQLAREHMPASSTPALFHDAEREVGGSRGLHRAEVFQMDHL